MRDSRFEKLLDRRPRGSSSVGRASASQAEGREFEPRLPLFILIINPWIQEL